ncbi:MAG TPA: hypothetical protein VKD90_10780, partial [Gemmataceae bacterium]|nr:hypothetical protein [Gemmataceae bacterium]
AVRMDDERIDTYRAELAEHRLSTIEAAVTAFQANTGRAPERLVDLVPAFLPNAEALHCPTHSLEYPDYQLLGARDPDSAGRVASYRIEPVPGSAGGVRVIQTHGLPLGGAATSGR